MAQTAPPLNLLHNLWNEFMTFDINIATENNMKIFRFGSHKGPTQVEPFLDVMYHMQIIQGGVIQNNGEN